jgi:hypothetical protein
VDIRPQCIPQCSAHPGSAFRSLPCVIVIVLCEPKWERCVRWKRLLRKAWVGRGDAAGRGRNSGGPELGGQARPVHLRSRRPRLFCTWPSSGSSVDKQPSLSTGTGLHGADSIFLCPFPTFPRCPVWWAPLVPNRPATPPNVSFPRNDNGNCGSFLFISDSSGRHGLCSEGPRRQGLRSGAQGMPHGQSTAHLWGSRDKDSWPEAVTSFPIQHPRCVARPFLAPLHLTRYLSTAVYSVHFDCTQQRARIAPTRSRT